MLHNMHRVTQQISCKIGIAPQVSPKLEISTSGDLLLWSLSKQLDTGVHNTVYTAQCPPGFPSWSPLPLFLPLIAVRLCLEEHSLTAITHRKIQMIDATPRMFVIEKSSLQLNESLGKYPY